MPAYDTEGEGVLLGNWFWNGEVVYRISASWYWRTVASLGLCELLKFVPAYNRACHCLCYALPVPPRKRARNTDLATSTVLLSSRSVDTMVMVIPHELEQGLGSVGLIDRDG